MDWYDITGRYHEKTFPQGGRLSSLPEEWQRELAAFWRLEADINNGGYLQFLVNWGRESYECASRGLKRIGVKKMAKIIDDCQALVDAHADTDRDLPWLMPNRVMGAGGKVVKESGSVLPEPILNGIMELSFEFMEYPEDIAALGLARFRGLIETEDVAD